MTNADLRKFATPRQIEYLDAIEKYGSIRTAARRLEVHHSSVSGAIRRLREHAAKSGVSHAGDVSDHVPPHHFEKGRSTYVSASGDVSRWIKTDTRKVDQLEALREAVTDVCADTKPLRKIKAPKKVRDSDLLIVYPMGDPHVGLFSWAKETGHDFDLQIAQRNLVTAVDMLTSLAPPSKQALILNVGDFFHGDDTSNRTARAGHALDIDTRWRKVLAVGIETMERCIRRALQKHKTVRVINVEGNHDDHSAVMLSLVLDARFRNNSRVEIDMSATARRYMRHGRCLIGAAHGHNEKLTDLPLIMATERQDDWGATAFRYWYTGHYHHEMVKELRGCRVESFGTLAARDAWAASKGFFSARDMQLIVLHKDRGEIQRHRVGIEQIEGVKREQESN